MKEFLKYTLATIVGLFLTGFIFIFLGIISLAGLIGSAETETQVKNNSVLFLDFNGMLTERSVDNPFAAYLNDQFNEYGLDDILTAIRKAKETDEVKGIYIQSSALGASFASTQEIRNALADFKESGKFITTYADTYSQGLYYLSSIADKVLINPQGAIEWKGLASQPVFYKELLEKLGIEMQIFKVGTYKSAVEPFINTQMSDANREQVQVFMQSIWNQLTADISQSRNIPTEKLNEYADRMLLFNTAEELKSYGLVDSIVYQNEVRNCLKQQLGLDKDDKLHTLSLDEMIHVKKNTPKDKSGNILAVYYAYGEIDNQSNSNGLVSKKVIKDLRKLREDENVKAVVLRVNSPGGSAYGSEQIWNELRLLKAEKPLIVSMGDFAASGGYYISCVADSIVAQPTTLTGSIGIFGMIPNFKKLTDKVGVNFDMVKTNEHADFGTLVRDMTGAEKALMQTYINRGYSLFLKRCADGRGMSTEAIGKIAEGRVWTGATAKELGLVDELGGLDKAIEIAAAKANISNYTLLEYPKKKDFLTTLLDQGTTSYIQSKIGNSFLGKPYQSIQFIQNVENMDAMQARMPFDLNIE